MRIQPYSPRHAQVEFRWWVCRGCIYIPRPRYLPTADDPPSRVSPRSPRGSSPPSRSAPFARCYRHFRSQYHLPPAASRPPAVDPRSCVSKHRFADQLKARFLTRTLDTTKGADSDTQMYAESMNNGRVSKSRREEEDDSGETIVRVASLVS